ncbi:MAG TPA: NAD-binding protein [Pseudonocardia sp.]
MVAFVLGVVGLAQYGPAPHRPSDLVYHALQLFVLGSDPLQDGSPLPWELEVARILAPATTVVALFETLRTLWREERVRRKIARRKGHNVVCGNDPVSRELARNLVLGGASVVRVEPGTRGVTVDRDGVAVLRGDPREQTTLEAAGIRGAATVYACAAGSGDNAAVALAAARLRQLNEPQPPRRLSVFAQVADDDLVQALRVRRLVADRSRGASVDFFSVEDVAARLLVAKPAVNGRSALAVVGSGVVATALLRALVRTPPATGTRTVTVHTDDAAEVDQLAARFRAAERGTPLRVVAADEPVGAGTEVVIVCRPDDEATLVRDDKHHPDLVDWLSLSDDSRRKDIEAVRQLPELLAAAGLYIARLP